MEKEQHNEIGLQDVPQKVQREQLQVNVLEKRSPDSPAPSSYSGNRLNKVEVADEQTIRLFHTKSLYLLHQDVFDIDEIDMLRFIGLVFDRDIKGDVEIEPFEEINSEEYQLWRKLDAERRQNAPDDKDKPLPKIDYSGYGVWRYNPVVLFRAPNKYGTIKNQHRILLADDIETWKFLEQRDFAIMSPITYVGRNRYAKNARYLYAFALDLDGVGEKQIVDVIFQMTSRSGFSDSPLGHSPVANIIVNSGHGLHLYYLLEHPIALYKENVPLLRRLKTALTNVVWNEKSSRLKDIQYQGIFQGFRMPGTKTKFGETIRAFQNHDAPYHSIRELNAFLGNELTDAEIKQLEGKAPMQLGVTRDEAKRQWPDWYEKVVVVGDKLPKRWHIKRDLYDWWMRRLKNPHEKIVQGHRYFCLLALAIYAAKCGITQEELINDAYSLLGRMDALTEEDDNHFTEQDIEDALMGYKKYYCTFPRNSIEYLTGLRMPENRRNGRSQQEHIKRITILRDIDYPDGSWRGRHKATLRSSKEARLVIDWFDDFLKKNAGGDKKINVSECARATGLDRKTVRKWLNELATLTEEVKKYSKNAEKG